MRHQDLGDTGTLSSIGALIQLATIFGEFDCALYGHVFRRFWGVRLPGRPLILGFAEGGGRIEDSGVMRKLTCGNRQRDTAHPRATRPQGHY
jgi:hypothetical protein